MSASNAALVKPELVNVEESIKSFRKAESRPKNEARRVRSQTRIDSADSRRISGKHFIVLSPSRIASQLY
jgi:hypothetical protein